MQHQEHIKQIVIQLHIDTPKPPKPKGSGGTDLYLCEGVVGGERRRLGLGPKTSESERSEREVGCPSNPTEGFEVAIGLGASLLVSWRHQRPLSSVEVQEHSIM